MTILFFFFQKFFFADRSNLASLLPHELELLWLCSGNWCLGPLIFNNMIAFSLVCFSDVRRHNGLFHSVGPLLMTLVCCL